MTHQTPPPRPQDRDAQAAVAGRQRRAEAARLRSSRRRLDFYVDKFASYLANLVRDHPAILPDVADALDALLVAMRPGNNLVKPETGHP